MFEDIIDKTGITVVAGCVGQIATQNSETVIIESKRKERQGEKELSADKVLN
jgi:hypothetical protein